MNRGVSNALELSNSLLNLMGQNPVPLIMQAFGALLPEPELRQLYATALEQAWAETVPPRGGAQVTREAFEGLLKSLPQPELLHLSSIYAELERILRKRGDLPENVNAPFNSAEGYFKDALLQKPELLGKLTLSAFERVKDRLEQHQRELTGLQARSSEQEAQLRELQEALGRLEGLEVQADPQTHLPQIIEKTVQTATASDRGAAVNIGGNNSGSVTIVTGDNATINPAPPLPPLLKLPEGKFVKGETPSRLLMPSYEVVPFHGRDDLMAELLEWCAAPPQGFNLRLYTAAGGMGKTRLMRELCKRLRERGWQAGFLERQNSLNDSAWGALLEGQAPLLIVIDYAETQQEEVKRTLERVRDRLERQPESQNRVVLLSRNHDTWWAELKGRLPLSVPAEPHKLTPLETDLQESYRKAAEAYADALTRERVAEPHAGSLKLAGFSNVLFIHMLALLHVYGQDGAQDEEAILEGVLGLEREFWRKYEEEAGLEARELEDVIKRVMTVVTLGYRLEGEDETARLVGKLEEFEDLNKRGRKKVAGVLHTLYGEEGKLEPLRPDLLGEHLIETCLLKNGRCGEAGQELIKLNFDEPEPPANGDEGLTVLIRLAQRRAKVGVTLLREVLEPRWLVLAERAANLMPHYTTELRDLAAKATEKAYQFAKDPAERAGWANNLGNRLGELGQYEQALEAARESALIYLNLATDNSTFLPSLIMALNNYGVRLNALGRLGESLDVTKEAIQFYRKLILIAPDIFLPDLALSLNNLSIRLSNLGHYKNALEAIQEAVEIDRKNADKQPDLYLPDLARSLNNLGLCLGHLGRNKEAHKVVQEAVDIRCRLASEQPDAFMSYLADSLVNLGVIKEALGQGEEAIEITEEAIAIYRPSAQAQPDAFLPDLASALSNLGIWHTSLDQHEKALLYAQESVLIFLDLSKRHASTFLPNFALSLINIGDILAKLGRHETAIEILKEAFEIYHQLVKEQPDIFTPFLASCFNNLSCSLNALGKSEEALQASHKSVELLSTFFLHYPASFFKQMKSHLTNYQRFCKEQNRPTDDILISPIFKTLEQLSPPPPDSE